MKNVLLVNSGKVLFNSGAQLGNTMQQVAFELLTANGFKVEQTFVDKGYVPEEETQKLMNADILIHQFPGWWMSYPWITKKWMDEVFVSGKIFATDGRHRVDPDMNYGTGGLMQGKKYMFSTTWNAPVRAFEDPTQFFEGKGIDGLLFHMHKAHQFIGMTALPSFMCNDVIKAPTVEKYIADYKEHLTKNIIKKS